MPNNEITTLDQLEEKLTLALTDLLLLRDSNNEDYKVKASTILQAAVDKAGAELIGGNVESGNTKAVTGDTVNTTLDSYAKSYNYDATKLDFNDFTKTGFYRIGNINNYSNAPSGAASYGQLIVSCNGDSVYQQYMGRSSLGAIYIRCSPTTSLNSTPWRTVIKGVSMTRGEGDSPILQISAIGLRPCAILAFGSDGINLVSFTGQISTGEVKVVFGTQFINFDTTNGNITISNLNREVEFILPDNKTAIFL